MSFSALYSSLLPCPTPSAVLSSTSAQPPSSQYPFPTSYSDTGTSRQSTSSHVVLIAVVVPCGVVIAALAGAFVATLTCCLLRERKRRRRLALSTSEDPAYAGKGGNQIPTGFQRPC